MDHNSEHVILLVRSIQYQYAIVLTFFGEILLHVDWCIDQKTKKIKPPRQHAALIIASKVLREATIPLDQKLIEDVEITTRLFMATYEKIIDEYYRFDPIDNWSREE